MRHPWISQPLALAAILTLSGCPEGVDSTDAGSTAGETGGDDGPNTPAWTCALGCGNGVCEANFGEDCESCVVDCGEDQCGAGPSFGPGDTAIVFGNVFEDRCNDGVYRALPTRALVEGAQALPFKQGQSKVLIAPPGCGGVNDQEPTIATAVGLRDGSLGFTAQCLTLVPNGKGVPLEVGLRYEVGRWHAPNPAQLPGFYARPGSLNLAPFWFTSWSRRLHGEFPEWTAEPWASSELPDSFELLLEDYTSYQFEREDDTPRYHQPGVGPNAAVAFAEIVQRDDPGSCQSTGDPSRFIADNDVILHYADGTRDVFSGRDLTFKVHVDNFQNHLVVTHGMRAGAGDPACGPDIQATGIKRISSYPVDSDEPLAWIDLEHRYEEVAHPAGADGVVGLWRLQRIVDSEGRVLAVEYEQGAPDRVSTLTAYPGQVDEQRYEFGYDSLGVLDSLAMPVADGDGYNTLSLVHQHPSSPATGGLSRVLSQTRSVSGQAATTSFTWLAGQDYDLEVSYPNGRIHRFGHQLPQGPTATPLMAADRDANRVTNQYNIDATSNPSRTAYDPLTGFVTEECDQLSFGPSGDGSAPAPRCSGYVYDDNFDLVEIASRNEDGAVVHAELEYQVFEPGNDHRLLVYRGPMGDESRYEYAVASTWFEGRIDSVQLRELRDPLANVTRYDWCAGTASCPKGLIARVVSPVGGETSFIYSSSLGTPTLRREPDETQQRLGYDARGCMVETDDVHGVKTRYEYAAGQGDCRPVRSVRNPGGTLETVTLYEYDQARNLIARTDDATGQWSNSVVRSEYSYQVIDVFGTVAVVDERRAGVGGSFFERVTHRYDAVGLLLENGEPNMMRSTTLAYQFYASGDSEVSVSRSGISAAKTESYDASGAVLRTTDERGVSNEFVYSDNSGRKIESRSGAGNEQILAEYAYFDDGLLRELRGSDATTIYEYDQARRARSVTTNDISDEIDLDPAGRPTAQRQVMAGATVNEVQYTYDHEGRGSRVKTTTTVPDGGGDGLTTTNHYKTESMAWGACQSSSPGDCYKTVEVETPRQVNGQPTSQKLGYDELGRLTQVSLLGVEPVLFTYAYDNLDCLRSIQGGGRSQSFECDALGRTIGEQEWAQRSWDFYPDGSMRSFVDFNGTATHYELDASRWRIATIRYENEPAGVVAIDDINFTYLQNDLLATMTDGAGFTEHDYDSLNRLVARSFTPSHAGGVTRTLGYTYHDNSERLAALDYWGQGTVYYDYDSAGRLATLTPFGGAAHSYQFHDDGRVISQSSSVASTLNIYDPLRRLAAITTTAGASPGAGPNILTIDYDPPGLPGRDEHGNVRGVLERWTNEQPLASEFSYDAAERLQGIELPPLDPDLWSDEPSDALAAFFDANEYDARGNPTRMMGRELAYDTHDRITSVGYGFDQNGNLVCYGDDANCHCFNGAQDADETGVDCGGVDCECCVGDDEPKPTPSFVGTACPLAGGTVDWAALAAESASYTNPQELQFGMGIPYNGDSGCGSVSYELPVPCGDGSFIDYEMFRMGGAIATLIIPFLGDNWVHNPGYFAEGMMDPFYSHPAKSAIVSCQGGGAGLCLIGNYGDGLSDFPQEPCDLARQADVPAPMQPGPGAYGGNIRAFPVYQRNEPAQQYPPGYQLCYDVIDFHAQGGVVGTCQNDGKEHGTIYVVMRGLGGCL